MNMQAEIESHEKKLEAAATTPEKVETLLSFGKLLVHTDAVKTRSLAQQARELIVHSELYKLLKSGEKKAFKNPENAAKKHLAETYFLMAESERNVRNFEQAILWGQATPLIVVYHRGVVVKAGSVATVQDMEAILDDLLDSVTHAK